MITVFDCELEPVAVIDDYISYKHTRKYTAAGDFEIILPLKGECAIDLDCIIDFGESRYGIVHSIEYDSIDKQVTVKGRELLSILDRRIVIQNPTYTTFDQYVFSVISSNLQGNRAIDILQVPTSSTYTDETVRAEKWANLYDAVVAAAEKCQIGIRINLITSSKKLRFTRSKGVDRSRNQSALVPLVVSTEFDNVKEQSYTKSNNDLTTTAILYDADGYSTMYDDVVGLNRREICIDGTNLETTKKEAADKALKGLSETLDTGAAIGFGASLGDIVTVVSKEFGKVVDTRITEIQKIVDKNGVTYNYTFGDNVPSVYEKINKGGIFGGRKKFSF